MNIELKNVKIHPDMSEETNCFSATIYLDGAKVGDVRNSGHGGSHIYYWSDNSARKHIEAWADSQETEFSFEKLDQFINKMLIKQEFVRWLKRYTKKETLFRLQGDKPGAWRSLRTVYSEKVKELLYKQHANIECVANENLENAVQYCA